MVPTFRPKDESPEEVERARLAAVEALRRLEASAAPAEAERERLAAFRRRYPVGDGIFELLARQPAEVQSAVLSRFCPPEEGLSDCSALLDSLLQTIKKARGLLRGAAVGAPAPLRAVPTSRTEYRARACSRRQRRTLPLRFLFPASVGCCWTALPSSLRRIRIPHLSCVPVADGVQTPLLLLSFASGTSGAVTPWHSECALTFRAQLGWSSKNTTVRYNRYVALSPFA
ncbi:unnamed protein product, partial [Prorocentrum cordatum]